ncbi:HpcH/HpaI aldolase/citrate lyase family protein [Limnohabitans sp.]|jgi:2-dehydro-3-deoxyglucarate aldolase/4-hydroxy-2-oxoheptanedioate aldolase|uniref:HpcH/HpaI aldolase/citrate lyase family protein n=1 Tax=Limnohabitans sp. TaxID=1907725 RepID=UPI0037C15EC8
MSHSSHLKPVLMSGEVVAGAMIFEFFTPGISRILANAGARFAIYDMEHTGLGFETLKWLFATTRGLEMEPMVRVPTGEYTWIARALDLGARGVMVPMVESQEQAEALARACRYPPEGRRGAAFGFAQCDYLGGDVAEKMRDYHARTLLIAQIETERGLQNVEAIAAVDGVDVLWVGHFDLSNFMGIPGQFDHPDFLAAMKHVAQVAKKHGKIAGFMATDKAWVERAKAMGYTMMAAGTDTALLQGALGQLIVDIDLAPKD